MKRICLLASLCGILGTHNLSAAEVPSTVVLVELKFPAEQKSWQTIAARFEGKPATKADRKTTQFTVKGMKDPAKGTIDEHAVATITVDNASGHVVRIESNNAAFSDEEMKVFTSFPELSAVILWHNRNFTGAGLTHLKSLPKLTRLTLSGGTLNDAGMEELAKLDKLTDLGAWHCRITDAGISELEKHPTLERVSVGQMWEPGMTEKTLVSLATLPKLQKLSIERSWLTWDGGLKQLLPLKDRLTELDLGMCLIEPADVERLKKELPNTKISWKGLAAGGENLQNDWQRSKAKKWIPAALIDRALAEAKQPLK